MPETLLEIGTKMAGPTTARNATDDALRRVIAYYLYRDLKRGWRVTAPNLEDCGLLKFDYEGLSGPEGLVNETECWTAGLSVRADRDTERFVEAPPALRACPPEVREEVFRTLLDVLRRSLAVKVDVLDPQKQLDLVEQTKPRLLEDIVWYLQDIAELSKAEVAYPRPKQQHDRSGLFVSSYGGYGRYLKRSLMQYVPQGSNLGRVEVDDAIRFLFLALKRYGIVEQVRSGEVPAIKSMPMPFVGCLARGDVRPLDRTRLIGDRRNPT